MLLHSHFAIILCGHQLQLLLLLLAFILFKVEHSKSEIIAYENQVLRPFIPEYSTIPKYAKGNVPSYSPGNGRSYIDVSRIEFKTDCKKKEDGHLNTCRNTTVSVVIFEAPIDKPWLAYWQDNQLCCTEMAARQGDCLSNQIGKLIIPDDVDNLYSEDFVIGSHEKTFIAGSIIGHQVIKNSGIYVIAFMACNSDDSSSVIINGVVESLDPYGYLPADLFGNLPFYLCLNILYLILGIVWCLLCIRSNARIDRIHICITIVLFCGLLEVTFLYLNYFHWNDSGFQVLDMASVGLFFGILKRTFSRVVVLLVSLGYDVVKSSIGDDMSKVLKLAFAYFICSSIYTFGTSLLSNVRALGDSSDDLFQLALFFSLSIDTGFYIWIIYSINDLLETLTTKKQYFKYILYRNFRIVLMISLFFTSIIGTCGSVLFLNGSKGADGTWQYRWTVEAIWQLAYFFVFAAMCFLWAPSNRHDEKKITKRNIEMSTVNTINTGNCEEFTKSDLDEDENNSLLAESRSD